MFKYNIEIKTPNSKEWEPLKSWTRPFTDGTTLDDTLDEGCINLSCTKRSESIPPFSKLRITISESDRTGEYKKVGQIIRVVGDSKRTRKTFAPSMPTLWDWTIQTLEETKLLERYICDSMTSTDYLTHDYISGQGIVYPTYKTVSDSNMFKYPNNGIYYGPIIVNSTLIVYDAYKTFALYGLSWEEVQGGSSIMVKGPDGTILYNGLHGQSTSLSVNTEGTYQIIYTIKHGSFVQQTSEMVFWIGVVDSAKNYDNPTITSVCERLLSAGITRRQGIEKQKFELDKTFADKYKNVPAPEFSFTRQTLFEALLTVGGYIHAIPRLNTIEDKNGEEHNVITFDELGGNDEIDTTNFPKQVYCDGVQSVNDFCSTLDSPAQNLLNTQDRVAGAITELGNDYITVRAEDAEVIIEANTAIIRTSLPINQIVKLECGFIDGRTEPVGDITPYVYEAAEYDVLSSYWGTGYPYSKGFALKYVQGDNKITGLQTKIEYPNSVNTQLSNPAIINIILIKTGKVISSTDIHKLAFRVTYVPIVTSRVTQRKPYGNVDGTNANAGWDNTLVYNQGGNVVESTFYGDKMKGAIARLGNQVVQQTYDFYHYAQLPQCGQKLNGMYIARVDAEYDITRIRATLTLTKDFNMLSQYVGLNSNVRMYDISEKQSVERFINYSENIYVGNEVLPYSKKPPMVKSLLACLAKLDQENYTATETKLQVAVINGKDRDGNDIGNPVLLPVVSFGFGNSIVFAVSMYDNYGAGFQNSGEFGSNKGVQRLVPYTDGLGEIESMYVDIHREGWNPTAFEQQQGGKANLYPQYVDIGSSPAISTGDYPLIIEKDSREKLNFVYQAHFVANRPTIILGQSLTNSNAFVVSKNVKFGLYFFQHELNMLDKVIDISSDMAEKHSGGDKGYNFNLIHYDSETHSASSVAITNLFNTTKKVCKSWAIIEIEDDNSKQGTLVIGENITLKPGDIANNVYFTIRPNE